MPLPPRPLPNSRVVILLGDDAIGVIVECATGADGSINDEQLCPMRDDELAKIQAAAAIIGIYDELDASPWRT